MSSRESEIRERRPTGQQVKSPAFCQVKTKKKDCFYNFIRQNLISASPNSQITVISISVHIFSATVTLEGLAVKLHMIAAVLLCFTVVTAQNLKTFTATYGPFKESYFDLQNSATISNGAVQLTPNSANQRGLLGMPLENQAGRAMLQQNNGQGRLVQLLLPLQHLPAGS
ncbi:hypothetical protein RHGRI_022543 [Rhododendron griersonianum]|uniref:Uncharacterized protein n=1 Tax=Rhododendron griersonianum TaxID=479676 RepID=A0AAV6J4C7_9ERIC|nr:hypothetical protein RHGRI_022543 [Rhododendron griersonianum]